jgi:hypothetical protein
MARYSWIINGAIALSLLGIKYEVFLDIHYRWVDNSPDPYQWHQWISQ